MLKMDSHPVGAGIMSTRFSAVVSEFETEEQAASYDFPTLQTETYEQLAIWDTSKRREIKA